MDSCASSESTLHETLMASDGAGCHWSVLADGASELRAEGAHAVPSSSALGAASLPRVPSFSALHGGESLWVMKKYDEHVPGAVASSLAKHDARGRDELLSIRAHGGAPSTALPHLERLHNLALSATDCRHHSEPEGPASPLERYSGALFSAASSLAKAIEELRRGLPPAEEAGLSPVHFEIRSGGARILSSLRESCAVISSAAGLAKPHCSACVKLQVLDGVLAAEEENESAMGRTILCHTPTEGSSEDDG